MSLEINNHRLRWLGHVLRMSFEGIPKVVLRWTPAGKREKGRQKTSWLRTVIKEVEELGLTLGEAQAGTEWRNFDCRIMSQPE